MKFVHGDKGVNRQLFGLIGEWVTSKEVHAKLGMPVTSDAGDVWLIAGADRHPRGFAQVRLQKNGKAHLRYLYVDKLYDKKFLIEEVLAMVSDKGCKSVFTNDREDAQCWALYGFEKSERSGRGSFCRWEKTLL